MRDTAYTDTYMPCGATSRGAVLDDSTEFIRVPAKERAYKVGDIVRYRRGVHLSDTPPRASPSRRTRRWMSQAGCERWVLNATRRHSARMTSALTCLRDLTAEDLEGLGVAAIGHRRQLLVAIARLRDDAASLQAIRSTDDHSGVDICGRTAADHGAVLRHRGLNAALHRT